MRYKAYGGELTSTPDGREKFGTYYRDGSAMDYADQRYYGTAGSLLSPDPVGINGAVPSNPSSWNRYGYVKGDPLNFGDPSGRVSCSLDGVSINCDVVLPECGLSVGDKFIQVGGPPGACQTSGPSEGGGGGGEPDEQLGCSISMRSGSAQFYRPPVNTISVLTQFFIDAIGGSGGYTYTTYQTITSGANTATWSNGQVTSHDLTGQPENPPQRWENPNVVNVPGASTYSVYDMPGFDVINPLTHARLVSALYAASFHLTATVTDSKGKKVTCSIDWGMGLSVSTVGGSLVFGGESFQK